MSERHDDSTTQFPIVTESTTVPSSIPAEKVSNKATIIAIAVALVLLTVGVGSSLWVFGVFSSSETTVAQPSSTTETSTHPTTKTSRTTRSSASKTTTTKKSSTTSSSSSTTTSSSTSTTTTKPTRPTNPSLPAAAKAVSAEAKANKPAGKLTNVYTGSDSTTPEFAMSVRDGLARHYQSTGNLTTNLQVTSPTTNKSYRVKCADNGKFVTCTGGKDAVIYIS